MVVQAQAAAVVSERLTRAGLAPDDHLVVVHVSAGNPFRRWPLTAFAALIAVLVGRDPRRRVIVTSGPSEAAAAGRVLAYARTLVAPGQRDHIASCGEFSLDELRALVDRAALYIGGDSGPLHIAATSRVPIVGLYGPTLPARSAPWRAPDCVTESVQVSGLECRPCNQRTCAPGDFRCLTWMKPEQVIEAAERALDRAALYW
jgi:ADP-heptose:LPS heptosyltransferase